MQIISFTLALALVLAAPSLAGTTDGTLPGVGTFSYNGPQPALAPTDIVASLTMTRRGA